ncbi:MAG: COX15/CtaA family protein [Planctomycetota bacterium]
MNTEPKSPSSALVYNPWLHRLALFLTCWTFLVVVIGGTVKSHEAGLSIPEPFIFHWIKDWYKTPNLKWEFFHRMLVGVLGGGTLLLVIAIQFFEKRSSVRNFSWLLLLSVIAQAVIGYLTVRMFAHPQTSVPHAALGQSFLAMMASMAAILSPSWMGSTASLTEKNQPSVRNLARANLIMIFVQLILGAALRHDDQAKAFLEGREWVFYSHLLAHFIGAIAVSYFLARVIMRVFREHRHQIEILKPVKFMMMLLGVQLLLGMAAALLKILALTDHENASLYASFPQPARVWTATAHVAVGALIFLCSAVLFVRTHRFVTPIAEPVAAPLNEVPA